MNPVACGPWVGPFAGAVRRPPPVADLRPPRPEPEAGHAPRVDEVPHLPVRRQARQAPHPQLHARNPPAGVPRWVAGRSVILGFVSPSDQGALLGLGLSQTPCAAMHWRVVLSFVVACASSSMDHCHFTGNFNDVSTVTPTSLQ